MWYSTVKSQPGHRQTLSQPDRHPVSNSRETDIQKRTDTYQATSTDRSPPVSLTTPDAILTTSSDRTALRLLPRLPLVLPIRPPPGVLQLHSREPHVLVLYMDIAAGLPLALRRTQPTARTDALFRVSSFAYVAEHPTMCVRHRSQRDIKCAAADFHSASSPSAPSTPLQRSWRWRQGTRQGPRPWRQLEHPKLTAGGKRPASGAV